ncbi:TonB-dependent hemoglobin/transferrin/lactoferrin family receptor [Thiohalocapsa sp. ML1]|uniref:TonB-dependent hemoglobin/transferrin/lactoferrin family receptor n=1 Tax=Thiohalocapsa sp. ML1 TaxID=1431688 RepID=UPI0009E99B5C|nr:TonB-dependent hemoglobin/transferrin/lactoferrin family receptor [Thiohalocapsa sp. ML1]
MPSSRPTPSLDLTQPWQRARPGPDIGAASSRDARPKGRRQLAALPTALLLCWAAGAAAQSDSVELDLITVTATKTEQDINVIPESVSVVQREELRQRQPQLLGEVLEDLPNVDVGGGPRGVGQTVTIRGIGDDRILFLLDGARQNLSRGHNARLFVEPELLRRVEVIRGPASALWGSGAIGGVVALETVDAADLLAPGRDIGGRIKTGYQDVNDQWMGAAAAYGRVDERFDWLLDIAYREAGDIRQGDGERLDNSGFERVSGLVKGTWNIDGSNSLGLSYLGFDEDGEVPSNPQTRAAADGSNLVDRGTRQDNLVLRYRYDNPDNNLFAPSLVLYRNATDITEKLVANPRRDDTKLTTTGFDLRNSMRFALGDNLAQTLTYGVEYYEDEAESKRDGAPRESFPDGSTEVTSVYLQDEILIAKRLTLIPGVRWDEFKTSTNQPGTDTNEDSAWSAKIGANLAVTDWLSLQASYNEAFRAPSVTELFVSGVHFTCGRGCQNLFVPNPDLEPEKAHNKELGFRLFKQDLLMSGDAGRLRATFFRNDVRDFIERRVDFVFRPVPGNRGRGGTTTSDNVRDARLEGYEIEAAYDAPRWFAGFAYAQTRGDDENTGAPLASVSPDEWIAQAGLRFPAQGVDLGWRGRFVAAQNRVPAGIEPSRSFDVQDIWLTWSPGGRLAGLNLDLGVDNLFDATYTPYQTVLMAPGRNLKAGVRYAF